jgi:hypothetical protein
MILLGRYSTFDYTLDYNKIYYELTYRALLVIIHTFTTSVRVVVALSVRLLDVILEISGVHVRSRCLLLCLLNYLVLLKSRFLISRGCSKAQLLTQVVFHLVEDVS